ncbi:10386_t:CDS:2, partial [Acaulospora colombiana]
DTGRLIDGLAGTKIALPNVKSWDIHNDVGILDVFDLNGVDDLTFFFGGFPPQEMTASIPSQLTNLFLGLVSFKVERLPAGVPHSLPVLKTLKLEDVNFDGPVRRYLHCPKLKELSYCATTDEPPSYYAEEEKNHYEHPVRQLFDESFFKATPQLEALSIEGLTMDEVLAVTISDCRIKEFLSPFMKAHQVVSCGHDPSISLGATDAEEL